MPIAIKEMVIASGDVVCDDTDPFRGLQAVFQAALERDAGEIEQMEIIGFAKNERGWMDAS